MSDPKQPLLDTNAAAAKLSGLGLPISPKTLATMATRGGGPNFCRWGRRRLYPEDALLEWAYGRLSAPATSTAEAARLRQTGAL